MTPERKTLKVFQISPPRHRPRVNKQIAKMKRWGRGLELKTKTSDFQNIILHGNNFAIQVPRLICINFMCLFGDVKSLDIFSGGNGYLKYESTNA